MTKAEEIAMFEELAKTPVESYFVDTFGQETTKKMIQNMRNDFPILCGTDFYKLSEKHVRVIKATLKQAINGLSNAIELMEKDPNADSAEIIQLKEKYCDLVFAENHLRN